MSTLGLGALKTGEKYTVKDWKTWPEEERWELIRGVPYAMSPAPRLNHQRILLKLSSQLFAQLEDKPCEAFIAPVDVNLDPDSVSEGAETGEDAFDTVVQPDLMIVCEPAKCRETGIFGAPDWILEILSSSTSYKDQTEKRNLYEKADIKEYWILNPDTLDLIIYRREGEGFGVPEGARLTTPVPIGLFPGIELSAQ